LNSQAISLGFFFSSFFSFPCSIFPRPPFASLPLCPSPLVFFSCDALWDDPCSPLAPPPFFWTPFPPILVRRLLLRPLFAVWCCSGMAFPSVSLCPPRSLSNTLLFIFARRFRPGSCRADLSPFSPFFLICRPERSHVSELAGRARPFLGPCFFCLVCLSSFGYSRASTRGLLPHFFGLVPASLGYLCPLLPRSRRLVFFVCLVSYVLCLGLDVCFFFPEFAS